MTSNSESEHRSSTDMNDDEVRSNAEIASELPIRDGTPETAVDMKDTSESADASVSGNDSMEIAQPGGTEAVVGSKSEKAEPRESEHERFLRLAADFDNYKKRVAREYEEMVRTANVRLLRSMLDVFDNFDRALAGGASEGSPDAYRKGMELIHSQFNDLLSREGVTAIESLGKPFDPNLHEAVMQMVSNQYDEGIICQEIQKGYLIDNRVVRHARVVVSSGPVKKEDRAS